MANPPALTVIWKRLIPGLTVIGVVLLARSLGFFQAMEWKTLDTFLRWRPDESLDERILIVGVNDADIQQAGTYPIPDADLAALLQVLVEHEARAIGIDIYRDLSVPPGHDTLVEILETNPNVFGIEKILGDPIGPPPSLPPERIGFVDFPLDADGFVRRTYLGTLPAVTTPEPDRFRFSLSLKLAEAYLSAENLALGNGIKDPQTIRFGHAELPRFLANSGNYVNADAAGVRLLINPRSGESPFEIVSMADVLDGQADDLIRDRVVLIGITSLSVKDLVNSAAVDTDNPGLVYGVEMQAHVTSQIISAVLDDRPLLRGWADGWEYLWIVVWGGIGILLVQVISRPSWDMLSVGVAALGLTGLSVGLLWMWGWWIPFVPTLTVLTINGLVLPGFYLYDQTLRSRIEERQRLVEERQRVIERTYDAIHNGPLQTLSLLLQQKAQLDLSVGSKLEHLDSELRAIYERLLQESLPQEEQLQLEGGHVIDLRSPLKEALYEVYTETLNRDFPGFDAIKLQVVKFETLDADQLTSDDKRSLCRFLEEALCNVGKHAINPKRLTVLCVIDNHENLIRVADNGEHQSTAVSTSGGRGTKQAHALAKRLKGTFQRSISETGVTCELRWPLR
ncbi:MAG: CHASE2 domain-containing protein [Leptolyngbya sp. SIOISBB]|nr:CHASE2 domain-containing protein [Leptolyngbya sp. SIOISBB]